MQLSQLVTVRGRFHRSVHLPRDWSGPRDLSEYFATPALLAMAEQMLEELSRPHGARAWTLTGTYGTGKSAFALFLTDLFSVERPAHPAGRKLRQCHLRGRRALRPLLLQAERAPLLPAILDTLASSGAADRTVARQAQQLRRAKTAATGAAVAELLTLAATRAPGGIALIVDELGKYLEYASAKGHREDVFVLQQLAEAAARSESPFLFVTILHTGFADYIAEGAGARRAEWQKVQGRFRDIPFALPSEQLLELVGRALESKLDSDEGIGRAYKRRFDRILRTPVLRKEFGKGAFRESLRACLPLHPAAALILWPLFRSKIAQNERSLFAFLSGHEPHSFQDFLRRQSASPRNAPLYGLPELYDYVSSALGMAAFTGRDSRRWTLVGHSLDRLSAEAPPLAGDLIKCIGLLSKYGESSGLRPSEETLRAALDASDRADFDAALNLLKRESIVVFNRHSGAFGLWEGSDVDLDAAFEAARGERSGEALHQRLERAAKLRPLVARAHYIRTGTLRFFEPRLSAADDDSVTAAMREPTQADGIVLFLVDDKPVPPERARDVSRMNAAGGAVLVAAPRAGSELGEALDELECWERVRDNVAELEGDPVARQEVAARIDTARAHFESAAGAALGLPGHVLEPGASIWFLRGRVRHPKHPRELQSLLSKICERVFCEAPPLHNELINRHNLSSAAAGARRKLLEYMVCNAHLKNLGIEGYPPEYSIYQSLLAAGGFHAKGTGANFRLRGLSHTESPWKPVWSAIEDFLKKARRERRSLSELIAQLQAPPFGLRAGPLPVLITVVLQVKGEEVALYEDGVFIPEVGIETLERMARRPETFDIRSYHLAPRERRVIEALASQFRAKKQGAHGLLAIVKDLVRMAADLPPWTQRTRHLGDRARAARDLLLSATDPRTLLLEDLPCALEVDLNADKGTQNFAKALRAAVRELTRAFPNLLDDVEEHMREALGLKQRGLALQRALQKRARPLLGYASDPQLKVLLNEAARDAGLNGRDWREAVARAVAGGKPPSHWRDEELDAFAPRLRALVVELDTLSELAASAGGDAAATVVSIGVLEPGAGDRRTVIACSPAEQTPVAALAEKLRQTALQSGLAPRSQLMALALAARASNVQSENAKEEQS